MIPVDQEFLHDPANGVQGDCFRAVLASIFERPIADVPHFAGMTKKASDFWEMAYSWMEDAGYLYVPTRIPPSGAIEFYVISGPSPRGNGNHHAVVGHAGAIEHDPHPSRSGLAGDPCDWRFGYIVPIKLATVKP